jgi:uncharacterized membrane-anchored protein YhcB (DUF1043 family)
LRGELTEPEVLNVYAYVDSKMATLRHYINTDYHSQMVSLVKAETSRLGDEIASDINQLEKLVANHKSSQEIFEDTTKKAMFSLEAMFERSQHTKRPSMPKLDMSNMDTAGVSKMIEAAIRGITEE